MSNLNILGKRKSTKSKKPVQKIQATRLDSFIVKSLNSNSVITVPKVTEPKTVQHLAHSDVELQLVWEPLQSNKDSKLKQYVLVKQLKPVDRPLITVVPNIFESNEKEGQEWYQQLLKDSPWKKEKVFVGSGGLQQWQPRQSCAFSKTGKTYTYAGLMIHPHQYTSLMNTIDDRITEILKQTDPNKPQFPRSYILVNGYETYCQERENKSDHLTSHKDEQKGLNPQAPIVSLSFGQTRWFVLQMKRYGAEKSELIRIQIKHGMLLLMHPGCQDLLWHEVDESLKDLYISPTCKWRINLTARTLASDK